MKFKYTYSILLAFAGVFLSLVNFGQTLIMNEVSQGETGGQEYVEFIVVDTTAIYDCTSGEPPCIDIRGWIIDDNSGYHGTAGIASGACRFSNDALWSCVPLGTIIVIYNDADPNTELTGDDLSLADGNCAIVAPISNTSLFETNSTTPGDVACSYPATGWTAGGNWNNIVMANGGDCFRLVDLGGCEVFSLCWDDNSSNNLIYFSGGATSGSSATNTVYYFNDGDPTDVNNWTIGCADLPACGIQEQTPGAPNNVANAAYIAQFNNGCAPIPPLVASATSADGCGCTGSATASATGSIPGYSYEWYDDAFVSIGQSGANATGLCVGTYNVIVTSSIDCEDTVQVVINSTGTDDPGTDGALDTCASLTGSIDLLNYLGGTPDNTGSWTGPSGTTGGALGTIDLSSASAGTYTYTVGTSPCTSSADVVLSYSVLPVVTATGTNLTCNGLSDGTVDASSTGSGPFTYSWDNGLGAGSSHSGLAANTFTVTVTDSDGCTSTDAVTITEPTELTSVSSGTDEHCSQSDGIVTSNASGGTTTYTYNWYSDSNLTNLVGTGSNLASLSNDEYFVEIIDGNGCVLIDSVTIINLAGPSVSATVNSDATDGVSCDGDATASVSGGTGNIDYLWDNGNTSANATDLCIGNNCITVTDDFGCTDVACVTINTLSNISLTLSPTNPSCNGLCDGEIDATVTGGTAPIIYTWTHGPSAEDLTNLCSGTYELSIEDALGETATASITITEPDTIDIQTTTITTLQCNGDCNGAVTISEVGGTGTLTTTWTDASSNTIGTTNMLDNLCAGDYDLTITDDNGCTFDTTYFFTEPTALSTATSSTSSNCSTSDGSASVIASGGVISTDYSFQWTDASSTILSASSSLNNISSGVYYITVVDDNGCSKLDSAIVSDLIPAIIIDEDSSAVTCFGDSDGTIDLTITSPNGYSVDWTGPNGYTAAATDNISSLEAGVYNYTFTDINGCSATGSVTVDTPSELLLNLVVDSTSCDIACDGSITATGSGGISPYNYTSTFPGWTNGTADLCIGNYQITVTDNSGCITQIDTSVFHDDNRPDPTILLGDLDYCLDEGNFQILSQDAGGVWSSSSAGLTDPTLGIFSPSSAGVGIHRVYYEFSGICGDIDSLDITVHQLEDASFTAISSLCVEDSPTSLNPINSGGIWQGAGVDGINLTFDPTLAGEGAHDITYIISGQCPDTVIQTIIVLPIQVPSINPIPPLCVDTGNVQLSASISGGIWSGASNSSGVINSSSLGTGSFEVIYTIQSQCGGADTVSIVINDLPIVNITVSDTLDCSPMSILFEDLNVQSGNAYSWTLDGTQISTSDQDVFEITEDNCQELSVYVTDINGCSSNMIYPSLICTEAYPNAYFEYSPESPTIYNYVVDFLNLSSNASSYQWTLDSVSYTTKEEFSLNLSNYPVGEYDMCLTATNYLGCQHTYCDSIELTEEFSIFVPNTFTPNGSGDNDYFGPVYSGDTPQDISFLIFNRWGELIFEADNFDTHWDGTYMGNPAQEDVYIWKIKYKSPGSTTEKVTKMGHINLIR